MALQTLSSTNSNMSRTLLLVCSPPPAATNTSPFPTYKALNKLAPSYLSDLLPLHAPTRCLRSAGTNTLKTIRTKHWTWGDRAFSAAAPSLWNDLPLPIRLAPNIALFKQSLKTHLFNLAFTWTSPAPSPPLLDLYASFLYNILFVCFVQSFLFIFYICLILFVLIHVKRLWVLQKRYKKTRIIIIIIYCNS